MASRSSYNHLQNAEQNVTCETSVARQSSVKEDTKDKSRSEGRRREASCRFESSPNVIDAGGDEEIEHRWSGRAELRFEEPSSRHSRVSQKYKESDDMKTVFVDAAAMKEKVRQTLCKPQHHVTDYYKTSGMWQAVAKHVLFEQATLAVIAFNALWISIDTDLNHADILLEAHPIFQFAENFFCGYFFVEWFIRFMAFKRKRDGLRDRWFTFDSGMVLMMVLETWVMGLVAICAGSSSGGGLGNASILRVARLLRLSRMARMARLLRAMPELMILIKGMVAACRSVFFTLFLLVIIMYVFAIAFKQLTPGTTVGNTHFKTVPGSMYTLLLFGTLLDDVGTLARSLGRQSFFLGALFFFFVLLGALTVMNMLIGVLCEVVSAVAATEREEMLVSYVNRKVRKIVEELDQDGGGSISKDEFSAILENMESVRALQDVGVDVVGLVDFADVIFEEEDELSFPKFMEVVLQLRGTNTATVKDIVDLRKLIHTEFLRQGNALNRIENKLKTLPSTMRQSVMIPNPYLGSDGPTRTTSYEKVKTTSSDGQSEKPWASENSASKLQFENDNTPTRDEVAGPVKVTSPSAAKDHLNPDISPSFSSHVLEDGLPIPVTRSSRVQLLGHEFSQDSDDSFTHEHIPLESDVSARPKTSLEILSDLKGRWDTYEDPMSMFHPSAQVAGKGLEPTQQSSKDSRLLENRLRAMEKDTQPLNDKGLLLRPLADSYFPGRQPARAEGLQSPEWCAIHIGALRGQIATISKVIKLGLNEVCKIQEELLYTPALDDNAGPANGFPSAALDTTVPRPISDTLFSKSKVPNGKEPVQAASQS